MLISEIFLNLLVKEDSVYVASKSSAPASAVIISILEPRK